jgi:hypothetical protein
MVGAVALAPRKAHPVLRRRVPARLPEVEPHQVMLRPFGGGEPVTMIVTAREADFIGAVLDDLAQPDSDQRLAARRNRRRGTDGVLELHQPVHRRHHLVLLEAACRAPGLPRLDARKIGGMGLVLRRDDGVGRAGWMIDGARRKGWLRVAEESLDPDPALRPLPSAPAARQIATLIAARRGEAPFAEQTVGLFAAPPDLCAKLGKTILYGIVPVASAEESDVAAPAPDYANLPADEAALLREHLSSYLKERPRLAMPRAEQELRPDWRPLDSQPTDESSTDGRLKSFAIFLQQLQAELGAFDPDEPAARALFDALDDIDLPMEENRRGRVIRTMKAGEFCRAAADILVAGEPNGTGLTMPLAWPAIDAAKGTQLTGLAIACLGPRFAQLAPPTPKFDELSAQYAVRAFIRVRGHEGCPSKLVWSDYSESFRILPWWESDGPATKIALPDIADLKKIKPSVAVQMPATIANLLKGDPKKLAEGDGENNPIGLAWICSFSIPAITICAFIVLSIFLALLNLIFGWLAWIKICIPIPKPK